MSDEGGNEPLRVSARGTQLLLDALSRIRRGEPDPIAIAKAVLHDYVAYVDEHTDDPVPNFQPDLNDPAQALARRVQGALEREFAGEDLFPCVVVVADNASGRVGLAATAISLQEVDNVLLLGRGAARRAVRLGDGR